MASRPQADDALQSFRYQVMETDDTSYLETTAGFNSVTTPEISNEVAEYREGNRIYTMKFSGVPSVENVTLSKGLTRGQSNFWDWALAALNGKSYRAELLINVYAQEQLPVGPDTKPANQILCKNAFPTRVKPIGDLEATSSDVNLQELECACEELALKVVNIDGTSANLSNV